MLMEISQELMMSDYSMLLKQVSFFKSQQKKPLLKINTWKSISGIPSSLHSHHKSEINGHKLLNQPQPRKPNQPLKHQNLSRRLKTILMIFLVMTQKLKRKPRKKLRREKLLLNQKQRRLSLQRPLLSLMLRFMMLKILNFWTKLLLELRNKSILKV